MDIDSQKCPDCGKPFQSPTGAEAVCECSKWPQQQPTQPEGGIVYLLPCPQCGDQKHARPSLIGKSEQCQCGYEFRYTLVLSPIRPEPVGWMPTIQHHAAVCTQKTPHWWRQSAVPWTKRTGTYIREHVIPRIVPASISAWNWLADSVGSVIPVPRKGELENRDVHQGAPGFDTSHSETSVISEHQQSGADSPEQSYNQPNDREGGEPRRRSFGTMIILGVIGFALIMWMFYSSPSNYGSTVPYSFVKQQLEADNIDKVRFQQEFMTGEWKAVPDSPPKGFIGKLSKKFNTVLPPERMHDNEFMSDLSKRKVQVESTPTAVENGTQVFNWIPLSLGLFFILWTIMRRSSNPLDPDERPPSDSKELRHETLLRPSDSDSSVPTPRQFFPREDAPIHCPRCGSVQVHPEKRGWSIWWGFIGSGKIMLTCLRCNHRFSPGAR